jgi:uncharacterized protein (TIGR00645 family)
MPNSGKRNHFQTIRWSLLRGSRWVMAPFCLVLIIAAGVELFIPPSSEVAQEESFGLSSVEFAILKLRVIASITAIAAIDLLEDFINIDQTDKTGVLWQITILLAFVVSGLLLACMDRLSTIRH